MTPEQLAQSTGARIDRATEWLAPIESAMAEFGITTPARQAAFLAQIGHESGGFRYLRELASGLAYDGRADLGNTKPAALQIAARHDSSPGPWWKGSGPMQITGYDNHLTCGEALGLDLLNHPELLAVPVNGARSAAWFWKSRGLNELADQGRFEAITRRINGGLNGLAERKALFDAAKRALAADQTEALPTPPPEPLQPTKEPAMAPFIPIAFSAIASLIPELGKLFGGGSEVAQRNVKAVELVVETAKSAIGARNEQELVEAIKDDPNAAQAVKTAVQAVWFELREVGGGVEAARKAEAAYLHPGIKGFWHSPVFWISLILLVMPFMLLADVFYVHPDNYVGDIRTQIITGLLAVIMMVGGYWIGTSASSQRKDELVAQRQQQ